MRFRLARVAVIPGSVTYGGIEQIARTSGRPAPLAGPSAAQATTRKLPQNRSADQNASSSVGGQQFIIRWARSGSACAAAHFIIRMYSSPSWLTRSGLSSVPNHLHERSVQLAECLPRRIAARPSPRTSPRAPPSRGCRVGLPRPQRRRRTSSQARSPCVGSRRARSRRRCGCPGRHPARRRSAGRRSHPPRSDTPATRPAAARRRRFCADCSRRPWSRRRGAESAAAMITPFLPRTSPQIMNLPAPLPKLGVRPASRRCSVPGHRHVGCHGLRQRPTARRRYRHDRTH